VTRAQLWPSCFLEDVIGVDVLFSEVQLEGGTDGHALAAYFSKFHPKIGVLLASAAGFEDLMDGENLIRKPYRPELASAQIQLFIERRRSARPPGL
jgi:hypothetical protein